MKLKKHRGKKRFFAKACVVVAAGLCLLGQVSCNKSNVTTTDQSVSGVSAERVTAPVPPRLKRLLKYYDDHFDDQRQLLQEKFLSPGYHSGMAPGTSVHPVRESFYYAVGLLQRRGAGDVGRAKLILKQLLPLQQTKHEQLGYGAWPWLLEEPLEKMDSIDLNWADFCGSAIAQILIEHRQQLNDADLEKRLRAALRHAAIAIRERNVGAQYTNIAVLGGGVCAIAGEVLQDDDLLDYGRTRLQNVVVENDKVDSFAEYNSPPYGKVVIGESERILQLVKDKRTRQAAETIRLKAWEMFADSFHLPTQQWAGPHSRHSHRRLTTSLLDFFNDRIDFQIAPHPKAPVEKPRGYGIVTPLPCPDRLLAKIKTSDQYPKFLRRVFSLDRNGRPFFVGKAWADSQSNIASINRASFWTQRQPVNGYWRTDQDPAVAFRLRFLKDGRDFASMGVRSSQEQNRVLCALHSLPGRGDWHRSLDRPKSGIFRAKDLRVVIELAGNEVKAIETAAGTFALQAGRHELVVVTSGGKFLGESVEWKIANQESLSAVEAVCYSGTERDFDFNELIDIEIAFALQLQEIGTEMQTHDRPQMQLGEQRIDVRWAGLKVAVPTKDGS